MGCWGLWVRLTSVWLQNFFDGGQNISYDILLYIHNIVYLIENVYLLMMQNWTMHYEEEGIKFVGYQKSLHGKKIGQEVETTNTLNFSTLLSRIFFDSAGCPLLKRFLLIQIPD